LGEHTRALLSEAGLGQKALDELLKTKAIRQAEPSVAAAKPAGAQTPKK
jgi:hypothetical protein